MADISTLARPYAKAVFELAREGGRFAEWSAQLAALAAAIKKRLKRDVAIEWKTDESLVAGAVIRAGDLVIDGSVRGELERLATALTR
jgi:F0F1-type ATP synthase delta subunit